MPLHWKSDKTQKKRKKGEDGEDMVGRGRHLLVTDEPSVLLAKEDLGRFGILRFIGFIYRS
jgi:hypothetical protein